MQGPARLTFFLVLFAAMPVIAWSVAAQTLVHRPSPARVPPSVAAIALLSATTAALVLPRGTGLQVEISRRYPMKAGEL